MSALWIAAVAMAGVAVGSSVWLAGDASFAVWMRAWAHRRRAHRRVEGRSSGRLSGPASEVRVHAAGAFVRARARVRRERGRRAKLDRQTACLDELPELIDVVALGLSAGISFDAALEIYCSRYRTMLAERLGDAMRSWRLGMSTRSEALRGLAAQLQVGAFSTFVETVSESLSFGAPLVGALADQAESVRRSRRMAVEERIEKAPVKMLIPTGTLVLPAMLLAILGPLMSSLARGAS